MNELYEKFMKLNIKYYPRTIYEDYELEGVNELFCPKCGCERVVSSGNMTCHPEHWEKFYCGRCGLIVGEIDNSPFVHILAEMKAEVSSEEEYMSYVDSVVYSAESNG